jgi:acetyltransferase-like isoleucine patch superfamily enzyme
MSMDFCRIAPDVSLGKDVKIHAFVNIYGCSIGDGTRIGAFVEIQKGVFIGKNCKISSHTFICEGVTIQDNVFIGHNVTFINDLFPKATNPNGDVQTETDWTVVPTKVETSVSIGSSVTILCGVTIGEGSLVGAGSVVTRDIPPYEIWAGNPAKFLRRVDR